MPDRMEDSFIHFTPDAEVPRRGATPGMARRPEAHRLPPEALGRWPAGDPPPAGAPAAGRAAAPPGEAAARPRKPSAGPAHHPSVGAGTERRDTRTGYQDEWLNAMRHERAELEFHCLDGSVLRARLVNFDTYALIVESAAGPALLFKHAVRLVHPAPSGPA